MIKKTLTTRGFTLLEMLVSLGIFAIVAVIAVGALVRITGLNKQAQTLQASMNNIGYALENMSRDMRMRSQYTCVNDISQINTNNGSGPTDLSKSSCVVGSGNNIIAYESAEHKDNSTPDGCNLVYAFGFLPNGTNPQTWSLNKAQQISCGSALSGFSPIIDQTNTIIDGYQLGVYRPGGGGDQYARVFIRLKGYAGNREKEKNYFDIQTSVSERITEVGSN